MSSYHLNKLLRDVNLDPARREAYFNDKQAFVGGYTLTEEEREAVLSFDIGKMYQHGAHGLILRPFTIIHQVPEPDYLAAIRR